MGSQSDVRQGRAYVELYVKNSALVKGLADARRRLLDFGAGIATVGKWMMGMGTAIIAPLTAMVAHFVSVGDSLEHMSECTGMSVQSLSELRYAAGQTDVELEAVETGVKKMQKAILDAAQGGEAGTSALAALGLTIADVAQLSTDGQFNLIASRLAEIANPTERAAVAMKIFGKSGTALLPMIGELDTLRARARELGLVMTNEDAAAAGALEQAFKSLRAVVFAVGNGFAATVAPAVTAFIWSATNAAVQTKEWVKSNVALIGSVVRISVGVAAAGAAIYAFGTIVAGIGGVLGAIRASILWAAGGIEMLRLAFQAVVIPFTLIAAAGRLLVGILSALRIGAIAAGAAHLAFSAATTAMSAAMSLGQLGILGITSAARFAATGVALASDAMAMFSRIATVATAVGLRAFEIAALSLGVAVSLGVSAIGGLVTAISAIPTLFSSAVTAVSFMVDAFGVLGSVAKVTQYAVTTVGAAVASVAQAGLAMMNFATFLTAIGTALASVIGLAILFVLPVMAIRATVASLLPVFGNMASAIAGGMRSAASAAASGAQSLGAAIVAGTGSAMNGLAAIFGNIATMATATFNSAIAGFLAAWGTLRADIEAGWGAISAAISAGDLKSAIRVALAGAMLEWERFRAWMEGMWNDLRPTWNTAVETAAASIGTLFANAEIAWGDLWDGAQNGLRQFLAAFDTAIDNIWKMVKAIRDEYNWWTRGDFWQDKEQQKKDDAEFARISGKSNLAGAIAPSRSPEEKAAQDQAARDRGKGVATAITGAASSPARPWAEELADQQNAIDRVNAAEANFAQARKDAIDAATKAEDAKEARRKEAEAAALKRVGGADPEGIEAKGAVTTSSAGTFSARGAMQMGAESVQGRILREAQDARLQRDKQIKVNEDMLIEQRGLRFQFTG